MCATAVTKIHISYAKSDHPMWPFLSTSLEKVLLIRADSMRKVPKSTTRLENRLYHCLERNDVHFLKSSIRSWIWMVSFTLFVTTKMIFFRGYWLFKMLNEIFLAVENNNNVKKRIKIFWACHIIFIVALFIKNLFHKFSFYKQKFIYFCKLKNLKSYLRYAAVFLRNHLACAICTVC